VLHGLSRPARGRSSLTPTILERLYDKRRGLFHQLIRKKREAAPTRHPVIT
jgi:hypothetical protein